MLLHNTHVMITDPLGVFYMTFYFVSLFDQCEKYKYPFNNTIDLWDMRYYMNMAEERQYSIDHNKLKEYFPLEVVTKGLLEIYQV